MSNALAGFLLLALVLIVVFALVGSGAGPGR